MAATADAEVSMWQDPTKWRHTMVRWHASITRASPLARLPLHCLVLLLALDSSSVFSSVCRTGLWQLHRFHPFNLHHSHHSRTSSKEQVNVALTPPETTNDSRNAVGTRTKIGSATRSRRNTNATSRTVRTVTHLSIVQAGERIRMGKTEIHGGTNGMENERRGEVGTMAGIQRSMWKERRGLPLTTNVSKKRRTEQGTSVATTHHLRLI